MLNYGHDVGSIGKDFPNVNISTTKHRQVYYLTHTNEMRDYYFNRAFISFSFGGRNIEDFNLIVVNSGDRFEKQLYGNFENLTINYPVVDGQYYWGTYFSNNQLSFTLATDGIEQEQLDDFINWFSPGTERELILAEHPNRAIMARIENPISMSVIPFQEETEVLENSDAYETITNLYKGEFQINFIMDSPFWYSKTNLLARQNPNNPSIHEDYWIDANNQTVTVIHSNKDALKIIKEDRIPTVDMIPQEKILFGDEILADIDENIAIIDCETSILQTQGQETRPLIGPLFRALSNFSLQNNEPVYIYYAGTAPSLPLIKFSFSLGNLNNGYISIPANSITKQENITALDFNKFVLEGREEQILKITAPNAFISYNQAQKCVQEASNIEELRQMVREKVFHYEARKWVFSVINYIENLNKSYSEVKERLKNCISYFLSNTSHQIIIDGNFKKVYGILGYRKITNTNFPINDNSWRNFGTINEDIEDISEIILSDFLKLKERNHFNNRGILQIWSNNDKSTSHKLTHDFNTTLSNFSFVFTNKYY